MKSKKQIWVIGIQDFINMPEKKCSSTLLHLSDNDLLCINGESVSVTIAVLGIDKTQEINELSAFIEMTMLEFMNNEDEKLLFLINTHSLKEVRVRQLFEDVANYNMEIHFKLEAKHDTSVCGLDIFHEKSTDGTNHCEFYRLFERYIFLNQSLN